MRVIAALAHGVELLADQPRLGVRFHYRTTPPPPRQFRRLIIKDYAIVYVYLVELDEVLVVDYWHHSRDPEVLVGALGRINL